MAVKDQNKPGDWDAYYRGYQQRLAREYLIPVLSGWGVRLAGARVLEVGCGDGGCGAALNAAGSQVVMMDIEQRLVDTAREANVREGLDIDVYAGDICDGKAAFFEKGPYDLVVLRDVMEHLQEPDRALGVIGDHLAAGGKVFVVFPPYYSPYGAHQQILPRRVVAGIPLNKLPYLQLLPRRLFQAIVRGDGSQEREVLRLRGIRLTLRKFERVTEAAGFRVVARRLYLSRPTFRLRYGMPVLGAGPVGYLPFLRELFVTAGYYLLERH